MNLLQDAVSRLSHQPHVALFRRVLGGEEKEEVVHQWIQGQAMLTEACTHRQDRGEVRRILHLSIKTHLPPPFQGVISESGLSQAMRKVFPFRSSTKTSQLITCATQTSQASQGGGVDYIKMLGPVCTYTQSQLVPENTTTSPLGWQWPAK